MNLQGSLGKENSKAALVKEHEPAPIGADMNIKGSLGQENSKTALAKEYEPRNMNFQVNDR